MLVRDGYTSAQIAAALATQEFAILPRAITELVKEKGKGSTTRRPKRVPRGAPSSAAGAAHAAAIKATKTTTQAAGQFELKPDAF